MSQTPGTSFKTSKLFRALCAQASINCSKFSLVSISICFPSKRLWENLKKKKKRTKYIQLKNEGREVQGQGQSGGVKPYFSLTLILLCDLFKKFVFFSGWQVPPLRYVHVPVLYLNPGISYVCFWPISTPHRTQVLDRPYTRCQHSLSAL